MSIDPSLLQLFQDIHVVNIIDGRCIAVTLTGEKGTLQLINFHLDPTLSDVEKDRVIRAVAAHALPADQATVILGGDFNFLEEGEMRTFTDGREPTPERTAILHMFSRAFGHFAEVAQQEPTHRTGRREDGALSLGRLDRFYISSATTDILDATPRSGVIGLAHDVAQPSDHIPVWLQFSPGGRTTPTIPSWIAKHPDFGSEVDAAISSVEMPRDPFEYLLSVKDAMYVAKDALMTRMFFRGPNNDAQKLSVYLKFLRAVRDGKSWDVRRCIQAIPHLSLHVHADECCFRDSVSFYREMAELQHSLLQREIREHVEGGGAPDDDRGLRLHQLLRQWSPKRRRIVLVSVPDPTGNPSPDLEVSAQNLASHWGRVHAAKPQDRGYHFQKTLLSSEIQQVAPGIEWTLDLHSFIGKLVSRKDSATGPDGIPYSAWRFAGDAAHNALYQVYLAILDNPTYGPPHKGFNESLTVYLPKAICPHEAGTSEISREASVVRPIALSNTDNKIVSLAICEPFSQQCQYSVLGSQTGFVRKRSMLDNLLCLEADILECACYRGMPHAGLLLLDFRAAFPSLRHDWIIDVLIMMNIPMYIVNAIRFLYTGIYTHICLAGKKFPGYSITQGIKQGCPLSGALFALCIDPLLRRLSNLLAPVCATPRAFADDIQISASNLLLAVPIVLKNVIRSSRCTGLLLNLAKCMIVHVQEMPDDQHFALFESVRTNVRSLMHGTSGKVLGVFLGPGGYKKSWSAPLQKYINRVRHVRSLRLGLTQCIYAYNSLAFSVLTFVMQLCYISQDALRMETKGLQTLTACPFYSIPTDLLRNLSSALHWPIAPRNLVLENQAAMYRVAVRSKVFDSIRKRFHELEEEDLDVLMVKRYPAWRAESIVFHLIHNYERLTALPWNHFDEDTHELQRQILKKLLSEAPCSSASFLLGNRIRFAFPFADASSIDLAVLRLQIACARVGPFVAAAILKTICNAWATSARYRQGRLTCRFGCLATGGDHVQHYFDCPHVLSLLHSVLPFLPVEYLNQSLDARMLCTMPCQSSQQLFSLFLVHDLLFSTFNSLRSSHRYGPEGLRPLLRARARHIAKKGRGVRSLLIRRPAAEGS